MAIRLAVVGMGFGDFFVPIYRDHPGIAEVIPVDVDEQRLRQTCATHGVTPRFRDLEEVIASREIDAVHVATPIGMHAEQCVRVLESGKHCACAVPMGLTLDELERVVQAQRATGCHYMMMETAVYSREFLFVQDKLRAGEFGKIQFLRAAHLQDMEGWPLWWQGLPPMHYVTHAVGPVLALSETYASKVCCFGSGTMRNELREPYSNPFPVETALFRLEGVAAAAEVTRTMFETAIIPQESFSVYGDRLAFEWSQTNDENPIVCQLEEPAFNSWARGTWTGLFRQATWERIDVPDFASRLPSPLQRFTQPFTVETPTGTFHSMGGHGGSQPHLVHEFVSSVVDGRAPFPDAVTSAQWTAAGLCAHTSAMNDGALTEIPSFERERIAETA